MKTRHIVYFIARSERVPQVLKDALQRISTHEIDLFFDLDGTHALDKRYANHLSKELGIDLLALFEQAIQAGIHLYACQMNVMNSCHLHCIDGVEPAGVVTFLECAYRADAVFSY
ncbi:DsrE/DsrF/DrsH-like family protein [Ferroacidibacillus organovorans]|uniref:Uncharacterized protein n=1 Tax=Ferroacidibacillus organovorans TaxID=1765683 RepID=A0A162UP52_9BACL|nr:DsrE/DsrF/DrsH-like family protein [Ferroacidibacillus organovorans]KYP81919.1 hypothetical protein AYJ22_05195 [Ferroacidibacillus organovorans]OAG94894.1 hypothetical protein AYW79_02550 [Ferroacidibacillus organovorans]OPG15027.1 hypothetical protein B2M26_14455 [Ferroacidibacillus organovorans]